MQSYSWMHTCNGRLKDCTAPSSSKGCSCMLLRWGGKKQRGLSAEAVGMACQGRTQRQMHLSSNLWGTKPHRRFGTSTMKYTYPKGCLAFHPVAQMDGIGLQRHPVFPEELPLKMRRYCHVGGGPKGGLPWLLHGPAAELDPALGALRPQGGTTHVMRPSGS